MKLGTPVHIHPSIIFRAIASVVTIAAAALLLLLLSYYCCFHITSVTSVFPGVAELTTQLLRLISILWLPLCRINKFGFYLPRRYSATPYTCGSSQATKRAPSNLPDPHDALVRCVSLDFSTSVSPSCISG